jgi:NAD(P)-dependent dehydrogenase (short-subunit alcohol dehydrogenase family)
LVGDEGSLAATAEEVRRRGGGGGGVAVAGLDFEACDGAAVGAAVDRAWRCFDGLDAFVNCYSYQGKNCHRISRQLVCLYLFCPRAKCPCRAAVKKK